MNAAMNPDAPPASDQRLLTIAADHIRRFGAARATVAGAMALVLDMTHRFLQPATILADAGHPLAVMQARFDWVTRLLLRALGSGRV